MVVLGLGASLCWGVSDFLAGHQARRLPTLVVLAGSQLVALAAYALMALVVGFAGSAAAVMPQALVGGLLGMAGLGAFYRALAVGRMGIVAPIVATGTAVPVVAGVVQGDRLGVLPAVGIALAMAGVALASRMADDERGAPAATSPQAVALALLAAATIGTGLVFLDAAAEHGVMWTLLLARATGAGGALALVLLVRPALPGSAGSLLPVAAVGLLEAAANGIFVLATTLAALSLTAVAASLYPVVTVLLARKLLDERLNREQVAGVAATLAGVALMAAR